MKREPKIICFSNPMFSDMFSKMFIEPDTREWDVKTNPWLNDDQCVIIDKPMSMGATESIISKSVQCGMTNLMNPLLQCENIEEVNKYMEDLKSRYPDWSTN